MPRIMKNGGLPNGRMLCKKAIAKSYEDATIKEAYVAEKETGKVYKVILTTKDAQEVTVLLNEKGEEVKEIK